MKVIGITGGVGCGKSTVLRVFQEKYNACVIFADDVAKGLMQKGQSVYVKILEKFGREILLEDGELDRSKLAKIIFRDNSKRLILNSIVHPAVKKRISDEIIRCKNEKKYEYVLVEAALLIEDHYETICDEFWYIYADRKVRRQRLRESRGYTDERIDGMIASQLSEEEYQKACKVVIDNSNDFASTIAQIEKVLEE